MCLTRLRKATLGKTLGRLGKISKTPCNVAIAPIIQKIKIGRVSGVRRLTFFLRRRINQDSKTNTTIKSSALIYTQVFFTSSRGSLGNKGINTNKKSVSKNKIFSHTKEKIFFIF